MGWGGVGWGAVGIMRDGGVEWWGWGGWGFQALKTILHALLVTTTYLTFDVQRATGKTGNRSHTTSPLNIFQGISDLLKKVLSISCIASQGDWTDAEVF